MNKGIPALALLFASSAGSFAAEMPQMFGVNLAGGDFGTSRPLPGVYGTDYVYPSQAEINYYKSKKLNLIRLPFRWERVQHTLNAPLNETEMGRIGTVIGYARAAGMQVILDMHNYNSYKISGVSYQVGSTQVPHSAFQNVWGQIASRYKDETAILGYDLMNEPQGTLANWQAAAQAAVNTIRTHDTKHWVIIEGVGWAGTQSWNSINSTLNVTDSANRLMYSAHSYWDANHDGEYGSYSAEGGTPTKAVDNAKPFVDWLKAHNYKGFIGEYGVPYNTDSASWNVMMDNFMAYIKSNGLSGTYWAGGPWWGDSYPLGCEPYPLTDPDKPQMSVLAKYPSSVVYEAENVAVSSASDSVSILTEVGFSWTKAEFLNSNAVNDYVSYTLPNVPAGTYSVRIGYKRHSSRGKFQLSIDGVNHGAQQDQYGSTVAYTELNLGNKTFTAGDHTFRLTVTGKNASATGYVLTVDYIKLQP